MSLVVYLDTQDYISLFNEEEGGPKHRVLEDLLSLRDEGCVSFGFSFATIVEFITKPTHRHREERVRRGALIKRICKTNAFPYFTDLARGASFPNGGKWIGLANEPLVSARRFRRQMQEAFLDKLASESGLNRAERRRLASIGFEKLLRQRGAKWGRTRADYGDIPVSDELVQSHLLERFAKGHCSDSEFEERTSRWLFDPEEFSRLFYDYGNQPNIIDRFFGDQINTLERLITEIRDFVESVGELNSTVLETRAQLISAGIKKSDARRLMKQVAIDDPFPETFDPKIEAVLGKGRAAHFRHYLTRVMKPGFKFKRSDFMDLMQMVYAYDCDLFRCDKAMSATFRDFEPFAGKLVAKFEELPQRIRNLSEAR